MTTPPPEQPAARVALSRTRLPDGVRILVAGGRKVSEESVRDFGTALGRALMRATVAERTPVVLITGGRDGEAAADRAVVRGAREALAEDGGRVPDRVVTFRSPDQESLEEPFAGTFECPPDSGTRQARRFAMTASADAVVCIEGGPGTAEQATLAMALGRPCLPLPFTGGRASRIWNRREDGVAIRERFGITDETAKRWTTTFQAGGDMSALAAEVADLVVDTAALPCFVSMPYTGGQATPVYDNVVEPAIRHAGMQALVSRESRTPGLITDEMLADIAKATVLCAFLSDDRYTYAQAAPYGDGQSTGSVNPNVMYEAGYARALGKPTVLLADDVEAVPFNLRCHRFIRVGEDLGAAREELTGMLAQIRGRQPRPRGPIDLGPV